MPNRGLRTAVTAIWRCPTQRKCKPGSSSGSLKLPSKICTYVWVSYARIPPPSGEGKGCRKPFMQTRRALPFQVLTLNVAPNHSGVEVGLTYITL